MSVPEHLMQCFMVQSISIIHKAEAFLSLDHSPINPELSGLYIWIKGIVCQRKQFLGAPSINSISTSVVSFRNKNICLLLHTHNISLINKRTFIYS